MKYFSILVDSFHIFWKHKSLWLFGILLALCGQILAGTNNLYTDLASNGRAGTVVSSAAEHSFLILFLAVYPLVWVIATLAGALPWAGLIGMQRQAETENLATSQYGWRVAKQRFRTLFWITFLLGLPSLVMILLVVITNSRLANLAALVEADRILPSASVNRPDFFLPICSLCCTWVLCLLALLVASLTGHLASRACVLEETNVRQSIRRGWQLLRRNPGYMLLNSLVVWVLLYLYSILVSFPANVLWTPLRQAFLERNWSGGSLLQAAAYLLFYLVCSVVGFGILNTFSETVWTRLYGEFVQREAEAPALGVE